MSTRRGDDFSSRSEVQVSSRTSGVTSFSNTPSARSKSPASNLHRALDPFVLTHGITEHTTTDRQARARRSVVYSWHEPTSNWLNPITHSTTLFDFHLNTPQIPPEPLARKQGAQGPNHIITTDFAPARPAGTEQAQSRGSSRCSQFLFRYEDSRGPIQTRLQAASNETAHAIIPICDHEKQLRNTVDDGKMATTRFDRQEDTQPTTDQIRPQPE